MNAVIQILKYLKLSPGKGLLFSKHGHLNVEGYTDADWAGNILDRKSTSGYFTFVGGNLITGRSKKQKVVAHQVQKQNFEEWLKGYVNSYGLKDLCLRLAFLLRRRWIYFVIIR